MGVCPAVVVVDAVPKLNEAEGAEVKSEPKVLVADVVVATPDKFRAV